MPEPEDRLDPSAPPTAEGQPPSDRYATRYGEIPPDPNATRYPADAPAEAALPTRDSLSAAAGDEHATRYPASPTRDEAVPTPSYPGRADVLELPFDLGDYV